MNTHTKAPKRIEVKRIELGTPHSMKKGMRIVRMSDGSVGTVLHVSKQLGGIQVVSQIDGERKPFTSYFANNIVDPEIGILLDVVSKSSLN